MHKTSLFIFRQDLRVHDNTGLLKAIRESEKILPIFIFDKTILAQFPAQDKRLSFILTALHELDKQLHAIWSHLTIYHGNPKKIIPQLVSQYNINALYRNESYGHSAIRRDAWIQNRCRTHAIACDASQDFLLVPIDYTPARKVFTPFFKLRQTYFTENTPTIDNNIPHTHTPKTEGISQAQLENILDIKAQHNTIQHHGDLSQPRPINLWADRLASFDFRNYNETRNFPAIDGSSKLSPYMRFGIMSIREIYLKALEQDAQVYISELAWREFWQHIYFNFSYSREVEFQEKRRHIKRDNNIEFFEARKNGMTWYPIVDAGMRQLKAENRMHNRVRMVVASFLTKDLLIDRRRGEKHFADYLLDYDTNVNIWNRQRAASVWADPKPLRIFSPMLQSSRFDAQCEYIKKRIPELADYSPKEIHAPLEHNLWYVTPIVDHYVWSKKAKERYMESVDVMRKENWDEF